MTLSFSQELNGKPTYFIEKIWSFLEDKICHADYEYNAGDKPAWQHFSELYQEKFGKDWDGLIDTNIGKKLHTIRKDSQNRWRAGKMIHPVINSRTPNRFQFAPAFPCVSVQKIGLNQRFGRASFEVIIDGNIFCQTHNGWDKDINPKGLEQLAINDGFDSSKEFVEYFEPMIEGTSTTWFNLIHFTDLKY